MLIKGVYTYQGIQLKNGILVIITNNNTVCVVTSRPDPDKFNVHYPLLFVSKFLINPFRSNAEEEIKQYVIDKFIYKKITKNILDVYEMYKHRDDIEYELKIHNIPLLIVTLIRKEFERGDALVKEKAEEQKRKVDSLLDKVRVRDLFIEGGNISFTNSPDHFIIEGLDENPLAQAKRALEEDDE